MLSKIFIYFALLGILTTGRGCNIRGLGVDTHITIDDVQPNEAVVGEPVEVSVHIFEDGGDQPVGSVYISSGETENPSICQTQLTNGYGNCAIVFSQAGTFTILAHYGGDSTYSKKTATRLVTVIEAEQPPALKSADFAVSISQSTLLLGQPVTVLVQASDTGTGVPEGTVNVSGEGTSCEITLANGGGSCDLNFTSGGEQTIHVSYPAQEDFQAFETDLIASIQIPTTLTITSDHNPSFLGEMVAFTVNVTSTIGDAVPTGKVILHSADSTVSGQSCDIPLQNGTGGCELFFVDTLPARAYEVTGEFTSDSINLMFVNSTSTFSQMMQKWISLATATPEAIPVENIIGCWVETVEMPTGECIAPCPDNTLYPDPCTIP